jgi:hypothetical protein
MSALVNETNAGLSAVMTATSVGKCAGCDSHNLPLRFAARQCLLYQRWPFGTVGPLTQKAPRQEPQRSFAEITVGVTSRCRRVDAIQFARQSREV